MVGRAEVSVTRLCPRQLACLHAKFTYLPGMACMHAKVLFTYRATGCVTAWHVVVHAQ